MPEQEPQPIPAGAEAGDLVAETPNHPSPDVSSAPPAAGSLPKHHLPIPAGAVAGDVMQPNDAPTSYDDARVPHLGYYVNGDGNTVIAPKEGEEYEDTVKRAVEHWKSLPPSEQRAAIQRETANSGTKVAGTLGTAAGIGVAGPALLAVPGELSEIPAYAQNLKSFVMNKLAAASPNLFGEEAVKATIRRAALKGLANMAKGGAIAGGYAAVHHIISEMLGGD